MNDPERRLPVPLEHQLDEIAWLQANLRPGENLADFLPPSTARQHPPRPLFGSRKVKRWPLWAEALAFVLLAIALPALLSLAIAALAIALPFWCIWRGWQLRHQPKPPTWAPPRVIPPFRKRLTLWEKADRFAP